MESNILVCALVGSLCVMVCAPWLEIATFIRALSLTVWPLAYYSIVLPEYRHKSCNRIPLLWMCVTTCLDAVYRTQGAGLHFEPAMVTATTFGLSSIAGARMDGKHTHMILYALVGCILCVLPTHKNLKGNASIVAETLQQCMLMWCIGSMIGGALLSHNCLNKII